MGRILQFGKDTMITVLDLIDSQGKTPFPPGAPAGGAGLASSRVIEL